ncbi:hypothetical protein LR48_Vigan05g013000 [Vigna angularis]|uniref:Uncharacterized protein n=2 Tax=Phaseolus angularis TaxID=3914 RepID=A0A0L9UIM0_PHAAN|nr:uncharacterized protein LOC108333382 [Vigna angularis]KAG2372589.1 uncharacterized protein HKW66_Vig0205420 [Vigna angularis]KOM42526.1 hypothetical protein LR48_Vigan05g013000 [Vigna angularis]BAT93458.1 hypothetical protein VIGAN_07242600 [Vigna angularis var. angularis]
MATFFSVSNPISQPSSFASFSAAPFFNTPPLRIHAGSRKRRSTAVVARAGPNTKSILFAIALPSSLLAVTIFSALRMGDKLDQDWREEMAKMEAAKELDEYDDSDDGSQDDSMETYVQEEPALKEEPTLPHTRNRPKREA